MSDDAGNPQERPGLSSERARELQAKSVESRRRNAESRRAASAPVAPGAPGDDDVFRSVLRTVAADVKAPAAARVAAARAGLDMDESGEVAGLDARALASLPEPWLRVVIEHEPADLAAAVALLVEHELAKRLTPEPEPAPALA